RVYVIQTNDGLYVKFQIVSFYKGNPEESEIDYKTAQTGYYTFKYIIQKDESTNLSEDNAFGISVSQQSDQIDFVSVHNLAVGQATGPGNADTIYHYVLFDLETAS